MVSAGCRKAILLHGDPLTRAEDPCHYIMHLDAPSPAVQALIFCSTLTITGNQHRGQTITICPPMRHGLVGGPLRLTKSSGLVPSCKNVSMTCTLRPCHVPFLDSTPSGQEGSDLKHIAGHCASHVGWDEPCQPHSCRDAQSLGLTALRTWAFSDGASQWNAIQPQLGLLNETILSQVTQ